MPPLRRQTASLALAACLALAGPAAAATSPRKLVLGTSSQTTPVFVGEAIQFLDASTGNPTSWSWDFDYGAEPAAVDSTEQNPTWTFSEPGEPSVRLEVCNAGGCGSAVQQIQVVAPCTALLDLVLPPPLGTDVFGPTYEACHTITAGSGFTVAGPATVLFRAGTRIVLSSGFSVASGASFRAEIDPTLTLVPP